MTELRKNLIGKGKRVPVREGLREFINFDNAASTPTFKPVWKTYWKNLFLREEAMKEIVEEIRNIYFDFLGAPTTSYEAIFTYNTTEAISLCAQSLDLKKRSEIQPVIVNSILEHSSNDLPWRDVSDEPLIRLSIDENGFLDLVHLDQLLREYNETGLHGNKRVRIVAISGASNVLGVYNDLEKISKIVHNYNARLFVDAAQMAAHRQIIMQEWDIDYLVFSGHKVYAPFGIGVLAVRKGLLKFDPANMKRIYSAEEENHAGIAALGKALTLLKRVGMKNIQEVESRLTAQMLKEMSRIPG